MIWKKLLAKMSLLYDMGKFKEAVDIGEKCVVQFADVDDDDILVNFHSSFSLSFCHLAGGGHFLIAISRSTEREV